MPCSGVHARTYAVTGATLARCLRPGASRPSSGPGDPTDPWFRRRLVALPYWLDWTGARSWDGAVTWGVIVTVVARRTPDGWTSR